MTEIWNSIREAFADALGGIESALEPLFGEAAWGWAIIALTLIIRILLLPLAIKQTRSMRAMQALQPKIKAIQKKYKANKDLLRKDPQKYKARKQKMNEEVMALYQEHGVNPASGCLPLLPQIPIFIALFSVLRSEDFDGASASFYFFTDFISDSVEPALQGLGATVSQSGWPGWLLVVGMAATMFLTQRQMLARTTGGEDGGTQAQQQKIMMYVMPVFLAFISQGLPMGVLLYWVTTNVWQAAQQYIVLREASHEGPGSEGTGSARGRGKGPGGGKSDKDSGKASGNGSAKGGSKAAKRGKGAKRDKPDKDGKKGGKDTKDAKGGSKGAEGAEDGQGGKGDKQASKTTHASSDGRRKGGSARTGGADHLPRRGGRSRRGS